MVDKAATVERIREMFGDLPVPYPFAQYEMHPAFHADFYMNFKRFVWTDRYLNPKVKAAIALAVSFATGCRPWQDVLKRDIARLGFPEGAAEDIRALVAVNAMYNQFYKLPDMVGRGLSGGGAVGLRGHTIASTCLDGDLIELIGVVIGTLNGCRTCTTGHARAAVNSYVTDEAIIEAIQCAATMLAGCVFLNSL